MAAMVFQSTRKRSRDDEDDGNSLRQSNKKSIADTLSRSNFPNSCSHWTTPRTISNDPHHNDQVSEDDSIPSNVSEAGSTTDDSMEMETDMDFDTQETAGPIWQPPRLIPSSSWSTSATTAIPPHDQRTPRKSDSHLHRPIRPQPFPLQTSTSDPRGFLVRSPSYPRDADLSTIPRFRLEAEGTAAAGRMSVSTSTGGEGIYPSPTTTLEDSDEPHTPTTAAGSRLGMLSVNDMDIDPPSPSKNPGLSMDNHTHALPTTEQYMLLDDSMIPAGPPPSSLSCSPSSSSLGAGLGRGMTLERTPSFVRRQRQRSGAMVGGSPSPSPDVSGCGAGKKFLMGYRSDCDKCRDRVPGHMNHFVGAV